MLEKLISKTKLLLLVLLLFLTLQLLEAENTTKNPKPTVSHMEIVLKKASKAEKAGDVNKAIKYYTTWLNEIWEKNPKNLDEKIYNHILNTILKIDPDVDRAVSIVTKYSLKYLSTQHRIELLNNSANLVELTGDFKKASELYKTAWEMNPTTTNFDTLLDYFAALYSIGDFDSIIDKVHELEKSEFFLSEIQSKDKIGRYYLIKGFAYLQLGEYTLAEENFEFLLSNERFINQRKAAQIGMYYALKGQHNKNASKYLLTTGSKRIKIFPSPNFYFLSLIGKGQKEEKKSGNHLMANHLNRGIYVQTGSFSLKENAEYLVKSLNRKGFEATITRANLGGRIFYRVLIGPYSSIEESQEIIHKLENAGFEGVIKEID